MRLVRRWFNFSRLYLYAAHAFKRPALYQLLRRSTFAYRGEPGNALYRAFCWAPSKWLQHYRFGGRGLPATPAPWYGSRQASLFAPRAKRRLPALFSRTVLFAAARASAPLAGAAPGTVRLASRPARAHGHWGAARQKAPFQVLANVANSDWALGKYFWKVFRLAFILPEDPHEYLADRRCYAWHLCYSVPYSYYIFHYVYILNPSDWEDVRPGWVPRSAARSQLDGKRLG